MHRRCDLSGLKSATGIRIDMHARQPLHAGWYSNFPLRRNPASMNRSYNSAGIDPAQIARSLATLPGKYGQA
jgi:hypothetical protein